MIRARGARRGFSLVELMVILALSSIVIGGLTSVLVRQQRFYRGTADLIETRSQIRQAAGIIPSDLRGVSTIGGDILEVSDTSMIFWATIGQAVACVAVPGAQEITIPPLVLANKNTLASFSMTPDSGDIVYVYHDGLTDAASDDEWVPYEISGPPTSSTAPCGDGSLTGIVDLTTERYSFPLDQPLGPNLSMGTPLRFVRRTRYTLFQAQDAAWYLGYCSPDCAGDPQPIAGPFLPGGGANSGVSFSYQDAAGAATAVPANIVQVSIVVRGKTEGIVDMGGYNTTQIGDSLRFSVAIRNRQ